MRILLGIALMFVALFVAIKVFRGRQMRACIQAYGRGSHDIVLPYRQVVDHFCGYWSPRRPYLAVAYRRGVEQAINSFAMPNKDWRYIKADFMGAWETNLFISEGQELLRVDVQQARENFTLRVLPEIMVALRMAPDVSVVVTVGEVMKLEGDQPMESPPAGDKEVASRLG